MGKIIVYTLRKKRTNQKPAAIWKKVLSGDIMQERTATFIQTTLKAPGKYPSIKKKKTGLSKIALEKIEGPEKTRKKRKFHGKKITGKNEKRKAGFRKGIR